MSDGIHGTCRSCGQAILWVHLLQRDGATRKPHPVDIDPVESGNVYAYHPHGDKGVLYARIIKRGEEWPLGSLPRASHFATCPCADDHRSTNREGKKP